MGFDSAKYRAAHRLEIRARYRKRCQKMSWAARVHERHKNLSLVLLERLQRETPECLCCGCELDYELGTHKRRLNSATLDKVVPKLGYIQNNVAIVCWACNRMKNNMLIDHARMIVGYIERMTKGNV